MILQFPVNGRLLSAYCVVHRKPEGLRRCLIGVCRCAWQSVVIGLAKACEEVRNSFPEAGTTFSMMPKFGSHFDPKQGTGFSAKAKLRSQLDPQKGTT